jgi:uncharacterized membrane protein YoaK (UPF0700 family)
MESAAVQPEVKRVTLLMRLNLLIGSVLPFLAGLSLFVGTDETERYSAWTIDSAITAAFIGGAYWAGFFLTFVSGFERVWANARVAIPAVTVFTVCNMLATLIHDDRFHTDSDRAVTQVVTWLWLAPYFAGLAWLLLVIFLQLRAPGGDPPRVARLPGWLRAVLAVQALALLGVGLALFIAPLDVAKDIWPWPLTPLTGRVVAAWLLALGVGCAQVIFENDWRRSRAAAFSFAFFGALQLVVLARYSDDVDFGETRTIVYVVALVSILIVGVYTSVKSQRVASENPDSVATPWPGPSATT